MPFRLPTRSIPAPPPTTTKTSPLHPTTSPLPILPITINHHQRRHATLLRRPHRPYTFTQLLTLSDGSATITRTTSPLPVYRSTKDTRNHPMWNPSSQKLANVEEDEAGRLRAFRKRFGRGWDAEKRDEEDDAGDDDGEDAGLVDLISGYQMGGGGGGLEAQEQQASTTTTTSPGKGKGKGKASKG